MLNRCRLYLFALALLLPGTLSHASTQIRNVVDLKGSEQSVLSGIGIVVGLNGTGDGEFGPAHKAVLRAVTQRIDPTATPANFTDVDSIALVHLRVVVPAEGVRDGVDRLDVTVATLNNASSLKGGVLVDALLYGPGENAKAYAVASGNLMLENEEENPRRAKIVRGAQITQTISSSNLDSQNRLTLVLHQSKASWGLASYIAQTINGVMVLSDDAAPIAVALDAKNVRVQVPDEALPNLSDFIRQIMVTTIDSELASGGARVIINRAEGTIAMTKDVVLSPVIISHKGMTIQIVTPEPEPDVNNPRVEVASFVALDPENQASPRLRQLLDALNTLNVPAEDRIAIIKEIHDLGVLHAELIYK